MRPKLRFDRERPAYTIPKDFIMVQDTREQRGIFVAEKKLKGHLINRGLDTGDYSILGMEGLITIERKSKADLFGSLGKNRKRFDNEIGRMLKTKWCGLMVQGSENEVMKKEEFSRGMSVQSVYGSLCSMELRGVHIYFAPTKRDAQDWILTRLLKFYKKYRDGEI